jgi:hypothetical protein
MARSFASFRRRLAKACLGAALLSSWALPTGRGQSLNDRLADCGSLIGDAGCGGDANDPGGYCGDLVTPAGGCASGYEMLWFRADYLLWRRDGNYLPAVVTESPAGTPLSDAGILGLPTTEVVAGDCVVGNNFSSGFQLETGFWLNASTGWALKGDYFNAGRDSYGLISDPDDSHIVARPFLDAETGSQSAFINSAANEQSGLIRLSSFDDFQGAGFSMQKFIWRSGSACTTGGGANVSLVGGYRYYHQDSLVWIGDSFQAETGNSLMLPPGQIAIIQDKFAGRNEFHGFEMGLQGRLQRRAQWLEGSALVALGGSRRVVFVEGSEIDVLGNQSSELDGGRLTSPLTNIGRSTDDQAQAIPRFRVAAGWQLSEKLSMHFGYNLIIWNGVVQAADHLPPNMAVDVRNINPQQAGGGPQPAFPGLRDTTMVAHGLDFGLEVWF